MTSEDEVPGKQEKFDMESGGSEKVLSGRRDCMPCCNADVKSNQSTEALAVPQAISIPDVSAHHRAEALAGPRAHEERPAVVGQGRAHHVWQLAHNLLVLEQEHQRLASVVGADGQSARRAAA